MNLAKLYITALKNQFYGVILILQHLVHAFVSFKMSDIEKLTNQEDAEKFANGLLENLFLGMMDDKHSRNIILSHIIFTTARDIFVRDGGNYCDILKQVRDIAVSDVLANRKFVSDYISEYDKRLSKPAAAFLEEMLKDETSPLYRTAVTADKCFAGAESAESPALEDVQNGLYYSSLLVSKFVERLESVDE